MKKIFTRNIVLLCFLFTVERFAYYAVRSDLTIYLIQFLNIPEENAYKIYRLILTLRPIGYLSAALLIDRFKIFADFRMFFLLIAIGAGLLFFPGTNFLIVGMLIITIAGAFIKVNLFVQIFENLDNRGSKTDIAFVFLYLLINVFTGFSAPFSGLMATTVGVRFSLPFLVILPWLIFVPLFLFLYKPVRFDTQGHHLPALNSRRLAARRSALWNFDG